MITLSFLLATNSALTTEYGGFADLDHFTDESDNPQDYQTLYLGSINSLVKLQAAVNPGVDNIMLTPTDILPVWIASTSYSSGRMTQPTVANGYRYECTTAGTTDSSEPVWPTSIDSTVVSGTAVFTCRSVKHEVTEIILALDSADLDTNAPGAALNLGNTINGGIANAKTIYMRVINAVNMVSNNSSYPEVTVMISATNESVI